MKKSDLANGVSYRFILKMFKREKFRAFQTHLRGFSLRQQLRRRYRLQYSCFCPQLFCLKTSCSTCMSGLFCNFAYYRFIALTVDWRHDMERADINVKNTAERDAFKQNAAGVKRARRKMIIGLCEVASSGILWGINGTVAQIFMRDYGADPMWLSCMRMFFSGILFLICAFVVSAEKLKKMVCEKRDYLPLFLLSICSVMMSQVTFLQTVNKTNSATATVLQSLCIILVLVYVCIKERKFPRKRDILGVILAVLGTWLLATGGNSTELTLPLSGLIWGLLCAVAGAFMNIQPAKLLIKWGSFPVNGITFLLAGTLLIPFAKPFSNSPALDLRGFALLGFVIVIGTFSAFGLFLKGMSTIGSMKASLLSTSEPVTATITSAVWGGTLFSATDIIGFVLIIVMIIVTS